MKIIAFHQYNDYSGSPKVLKNIIENLSTDGFKITLITSRGGVLDELENNENIKIKHFSYRFYKNKLLTCINSLNAYFWMFFYGLIHGRKSIFYINTIMPITGAIAGKILGRPVVYHYHENAYSKNKFYAFLANAMQRIANVIICVSNFQREGIKRRENVSIIENSISEEFRQKAKPNFKEAFKRKTILFLGSLKTYKGVKEFIELSVKLPEFFFPMVINDTQEAIDSYLKTHNIVRGKNLTILPRQTNPVDFYNKASIVINLSDKTKILETFGLTAAEAFTCGLPVIVPTEGGIADLVIDDYNGYKIDVQNLDKISNKIKEILSDEILYLRLANNALESSKRYIPQKQIKQIKKVIQQITPPV